MRAFLVRNQFRGYFLAHVFSIAVGRKLIGHLDVAGGEGVRWFGGLTCVFWAENAYILERDFLRRDEARTKMGTVWVQPLE